MTTMMHMAGGGLPEDTNLPEFIKQAEDYRESGDVADAVFKVLNLLGTTHPFYVLRVSEVRAWIEGGDYDRIIRGEYQHRDDPGPAYKDDVKAAGRAYAESARDLIDQVTGAAKRMSEAFKDNLKR